MVRFNAVPHYAYGKLKMPGPRDVITIQGKAELHLGAEEYAATLTIEATSGAFQSNLDSIAKLPDIEESELLHGMIARLDQGSIKHSGISWEGPHPAVQPLHDTQMSLRFSLQARFCAEQDWRHGINSDAQRGNI